MGFGSKCDEWLIYTKDGCPHCTQAKESLRKIGCSCKEIDGPANMELVSEHMQKVGRSDFQTWPKVFRNGQFIGGNSDLQKVLGAQATLSGN